MDLDTNAHSVFSLRYHLILVTKYRKPVLMMKFLREQELYLRRLPLTTKLRS